MIKKKVITLVLLFLVVTNSFSEEISKNHDQVNLISKKSSMSDLSRTISF